MQLILVLFLAAFLQASLAEVTVVGSPETLYDKYPKLHIKGGGFDVDESDIELEISAANAPPLKKDKDYTIKKDKDGQGLLLTLLAGRRYVIYVLASLLICIEPLGTGCLHFDVLLLILNVSYVVAHANPLSLS